MAKTRRSTPCNRDESKHESKEAKQTQKWQNNHQAAWPVSVDTHLPVEMSSMVSSEALTIRLGSVGENAILDTKERGRERDRRFIM